MMRATSQADFEREREMERDEKPLNPLESANTPRKALAAALGDSLGEIYGGISYGVLWAVVGPKPSLN